MVLILVGKAVCRQLNCSYPEGVREGDGVMGSVFWAVGICEHDRLSANRCMEIGRRVGSGGTTSCPAGMLGDSSGKKELAGPVCWPLGMRETPVRARQGYCQNCYLRLRLLEGNKFGRGHCGGHL